MTEIVTCLEEIFKAETGAGKLLDGVQVYPGLEDNPSLAKEALVIARPVERFTGQSWPVMHVTASVPVSVWVQVSKNGTATRRTKEARAAALAHAVRKIIGQNRTLVSTTYAQGFVEHAQKVRVNRLEPIRNSFKASFFTGVGIVFDIDYVYRGDQVARI
jgi:hypothetical protein